jgi:CRISPR-associated protein Cas5d
MAYGIRIEAWGDYALFTRPEMKVERVTYDFITPSAARGLIEAVYWHPGMRWVVDKIHVCNPIALTNIRRNEVGVKLFHKNAEKAMLGKSAVVPIYTQTAIQQRASMVLKDVRYVIEAHFEMTAKAGKDDTPEKFISIATRRLKNGACFHQPCFGCREFPANFRLYEGEDVPSCYGESGEKDFGFMLYDLDYSNSRQIKPMFFRAVMKNGVIDLTDCEVVR